MVNQTTTLAKTDMVNARDNQGRTPLYLAAQSRDLTNVRLLLSYGADVKALTADGSSVLLSVFDQSLLDTIHQAGKEESKDEVCRQLIAELLDAGAPLDSLDARGRNAIHLAAELKLEQTLKVLLDRRGDALDIEAVDYEGRTALHVAAGARNKKIVDMLLAEGANVQSYTHERKSVLHSLLDEDIDGDDDKDEVNEIFDELVKAGAPVTTLDKRRQSLLHLAGEHSMKEIFQKLLPAFEDHTVQTTWGCTALHTLLCSIEGHDGGDERDLELCSVTALDGDDDEDVPEHHKQKKKETQAKEKNFEPKSWPEMLREMFERDERVLYVQDDEGRLPVHLAAKYKHGKTLSTLLENYCQNEAAAAKTSEPAPTTEQ
ncbi:serine/threonine-protein phosphatase 6 regulatory ankyrin repeat subunit A-like [Trichogramma pretiosum]|uniref:serine/threonine-protein phosphatase 6 regulatory ankyrin repeat subunit A-like n=1 Tax=Trichogramma pretiosum TaxID=7493 RepID=UPI0006C9B23E|nr:serine/threonine-protein phosphatase 6 regulatory ankyrin repeat subunit A-like [Trichogramma pretiosum]